LPIPLKDGIGGERRPEDRVKARVTDFTDNSIVQKKTLVYSPTVGLNFFFPPRFKRSPQSFLMKAAKLFEQKKESVNKANKNMCQNV
jgi:hypothetical protein